MTPQIIKEEDIVEKVFVNSKYEIVPENEANYIRIRLKDGRSIIGIKQDNTVEKKFVLRMGQDIQHAN
jgi:hypothetical protein